MDSNEYQDSDPDARSLHVLRQIEAGALFELDSTLNAGALDDLPLIVHVALALFQLDFKTVQALAPKLDDPGVRRALSAAIFLDPDTTTEAEPPPEEPPEPMALDGLESAAEPPPESPNAPYIRRFVLGLIDLFDTSSGDILSGRWPEVWQSSLHRYVHLRLWIYIMPEIDETLGRHIPGHALTEGEVFCLLRYQIALGGQARAKSVLAYLMDRYRMSGHLFFLQYLHHLENNATTTAKAWLLNARACRGIDERLDERVFTLFGVTPTDDDSEPERGLRALRAVGHRGAFAVRRGNLRHLPRPDSPQGTSCLAYADADLEADIEDLRAAMATAPSPWAIPPTPVTADPLTLGAEKRFVFIAPARSAADIGLAVSAMTTTPIIWRDCWSELMVNARKLEPESGEPDLGFPDLDFVERHATFLRLMWTRLERKQLSVTFGRVVVHVIVDPRIGGMLRLLWPAARFTLCVPRADVIDALRGGAVNPAWFDHVLEWRQPRHVARLFWEFGIPRASRKTLGRSGHHLRHLFYPV